MKLEIALSTYQRDYGFLPYLPMRNMIVEKTVGDDEGIVLLPRPGLSVYRKLSSGGHDVKAVWAQPGVFNGDDLALSGTGLYRAGALLGALSGTAQTTARFAASALEAVFCTGGVLHHTNGAIVTTPTFPDNAPVISLGFMDSYFVAVRGNSARLYWSAINDGSTWPALNYSSAQSKSDNLLDVVVLADVLALVGQESVEFWQASPSGDMNLPFVRIDGLTFTKGAIATGASIYADNALIWVGNDGVVYRRGNVPMRISTSAIEEQIGFAGTATLGLCNWVGHVLLVMNLPTKSYFYDFQTQLWSEVSSYGYPGWRVQCSYAGGTRSLFADSGSASILVFDNNQLFDVDALIDREFSAILPNEGIIDNIWLDAQAGIGSEPSGNPIIVEMRYSRDGSQTYSGWLQASLGRRGEYRKRASWRRLGRFDYPGGIVQFRCTDPAPFVVQSIRVNEPLAGRGV